MVDWDRRRRNVRILLASIGISASEAARRADLSINTVSQFTNGKKAYLNERTLVKLLPVLGLESGAELDTDNPINDPRLEIKRLVDQLPDAQVPILLEELRRRLPA